MPTVLTPHTPLSLLEYRILPTPLGTDCRKEVGTGSMPARKMRVQFETIKKRRND